MDPLWAELINSDWRDYRGGGGREDRLESPAWLRGLLRRCGAAPVALQRSERGELRRLRAVLRRSVAALMAGRAPARRDLEAVNRHLAAVPLTRRLAAQGDGFAVRLVARGDGLALVLGQVAASFAELLADGEPARIRVCANPDCGWVLYDGSRNRTRRWCESASCGNLMKVRRFRARRRGAGRSPRGNA